MPESTKSVWEWGTILEWVSLPQLPANSRPDGTSETLHETPEEKFFVDKLTNPPHFLGCSLFILCFAIELALLSSGFSDNFSAPLVPSSFMYWIFCYLWTTLVLSFLSLASPWCPVPSPPPLNTQPSPLEDLTQLC